MAYDPIATGTITPDSPVSYSGAAIGTRAIASPDEDDDPESTDNLESATVSLLASQHGISGGSPFTTQAALLSYCRGLKRIYESGHDLADCVDIIDEIQKFAVLLKAKVTA